MHTDYLSAKDLLNYIYCPRITYFEHVLHIPQATTKKEVEGRKKDAVYTKSLKRSAPIITLPRIEGTPYPPSGPYSAYPHPQIRTLPYGERSYHTYVSSKNFMFHTEVDCLITDNKGITFPVQFKNTFPPARIFQSLSLQMAAEAMALGEEGYKVGDGYVKFLKTGRVMSVPITENNINAVKQILSMIEQTIRTERIPEPTNYQKRCVDCCYRNICGGA